MSKNIKKPNFFIVGAARSGTTTLYHTLKNHPEVFMSPIKEVNYFIPSNKRTCSQYLQLFKNAKKEKIIGEASPRYLYYKETPKLIKNKINSPKILIQLRNPVERAISHYKLKKRNEKEKLSFKKAINKENEREEKNPFTFSYLKASYYTPQVKRYLEYFGKNNVKITIFEEFTKRPKETLEDICKFLCIDPRHLPKKIKKYNPGNKPLFPFLNKLLTKNDKITKFIKLLIPPYIRKKLYYTKNRLAYRYTLLNISSSKIKVNLTRQEKRELQKKFSKDIKKLEQLIGKNLSSLWFK